MGTLQLTPAYAAALAPSACAVRDWLEVGGRPYAGFSAGAAVAADNALVGGWRFGAVQVCPDEAGEDVENVSVVAGLGLTPWTIDVHCAQWGTLPRLLSAVGALPDGRGLAIDENTALHIDGDRGRVSGLGAVRAVTGSHDEFRVRTVVAGASIAV